MPKYTLYLVNRTKDSSKNRTNPLLAEIVIDNDINIKLKSGNSVISEECYHTGNSMHLS